jgi:polyketide biosynthesis enoyl-CoA hydratase PksI
VKGLYRLCLTEFGIGRQLTRESAQALSARLATLSRDTQILAVLLTGDPEYFCAGGTEAGVTDIVIGDPRAYATLVHDLVAFPVPVVVALEGSTLGAGLGLALAVGDFFVAAEEARYGAHFIRMGLTPGMGLSFFLQSRLGLGFAAEMLYSGKTYRGSELAANPRSVGLFDRIRRRSEVLGEAQSWAHQLGQASRDSLIEMKGLLRPDRAALSASLDREAAAFRRLAQDPDLPARISGYFGLLNQRSRETDADSA